MPPEIIDFENVIIYKKYIGDVFLKDEKITAGIDSLNEFLNYLLKKGWIDIDGARIENYSDSFCLHIDNVKPVNSYIRRTGWLKSIFN